ncbi:DgyrCDS6648 [Dimorphilus gyrociliatus]|uniref:U8 snoRNA-decapping enzyme n=1 Tax=Dimorphilus gyrociliatus TaxID=2664684 RepID=A0A7I8VRD3_9ANNE|nr:DgyrCDS6648 [Dimorphilus gyrociliatus]
MEKFEEISQTEALSKYKHYKHAAHAMLAADDPGTTFGCKRNAVIMMQMRFDGCIGFVGGLIDPEDDNPVDGLNRECVEEIALDLDKVKFEKENFLLCHIVHDYKLVLHFYGKKIPLKLFYEIEKRAVLEAEEWGNETLGLIRVPLSLFEQGDINKRFKAFLKHNFAGNAKRQLLTGMKMINVVPEDVYNKLLQGVDI